MKALLYAAILGFACWMVSDIIELVQAGRGPAVYYLTAAYHVFAGLGVWGLYKAQTPDKNVFNLASTALASVTYLAFTLFPLQILWSGLSMAEYVQVHPLYKLLGFVWLIGVLLFSVSVLRSGYFPKWAGLAMVVGFVTFTVGGQLAAFPMILLNINTIVLSAVVIYLSTLALRSDRAPAETPSHA